MRVETVSGSHKYIFAIAAALLAGAALSLYANLRHTESQYTELASVVGRTFFQAIAAMRDWNARHQGVYVPLTEVVRSNEYLADPQRDITCAQGLQLTKINHAQMTRMVSELLDEERGIHIHITSLSPLRPANAADAWERQSLLDFAAGEKEHYGLEAAGAGGTKFRYMAPLNVERACLNCHHEHKDVNEIRGGVSVSFDFAPFQRLMRASERQIWLVHLMGLSASLVTVIFLGKRLVRGIEALQASLRRVRQLEGLVPICANCKKIRTEGADPSVMSSWIPVEVYVSNHTNAEFTHGICPDCREALYPEFYGKHRT